MAAPPRPEGVDDPAQPLGGLVDGDQAVGPAGHPSGGLRADRGADQRWRRRRARPQLGPVDGDQAPVADGLAGEQGPDDLDTLQQAVVAGLLVGPSGPGDVLVERLPAAQGDPEAPGEQLGQGGRGLGDDRRVVALPGRVDAAEREAGGLHGRAQPGPGEAGVSLGPAPGREVVGAHRRLEPGLLGQPDIGQQRARGQLLVGGVVAEDRHGPWLPAGRPVKPRVALFMHP